VKLGGKSFSFSTNSFDTGIANEREVVLMSIGDQKRSMVLKCTSIVISQVVESLGHLVHRKWPKQCINICKSV
jgi:hypothetical protein